MDCIIRNVGSQVEVDSRSGVFLFSAENTREAMEELGQAGWACKAAIRPARRMKNLSAGGER